MLSRNRSRLEVTARSSAIPCCRPGFARPRDCGDTDKRGLQLVESLDTVVGKTDVLLERHDVLEGVLNNFLADALLDVTRNSADVDISMTNGFRFGTPVLSSTEAAAGAVFADGRDPRRDHIARSLYMVSSRTRTGDVGLLGAIHRAKPERRP